MTVEIRRQLHSLVLWQRRAYPQIRQACLQVPEVIDFSGVPDLSVGQCESFWPFYLDLLVRDILGWELLVQASRF